MSLAKFQISSNEFTVWPTMSVCLLFSSASQFSFLIFLFLFLFAVPYIFFIQQQLQTHIVFAIYYCWKLKEFRLFPFPFPFRFQFQSRFRIRFLAAVEIQNGSNIALKTLFIEALVNATTGNLF